MAATQRHDRRDLEDNFEPQYSNFYEDDYEDFDYDEDEEEMYGQVASDSEIEGVVKELIHNSRRLDGDDLTVSVDHADVTLKGTVRTEDEKYIAGSLVQLIHGVGLIRNEIIVKRNEGILPTDVGRHE